MKFLRKLFDTSKRDVDAVAPVVVRINEMEPQFEAMSNEDLYAKGPEFQKRARDGETLDALLPEVFAVVRELSKRLLKMRHFDVQLIGGAVLHQGRIGEMKTGEGKTLVAVAPMILNALTGRGAHLVTVNDYLARRDAVWMGPIYHALGLSIGIIQGQGADSDELGGSYTYTPGTMHEDPRYLNLTPCSRREAYSCDIVYGTNHEFGFDYLRDNMAMSEEQLVMKELHFAIVDEVDSILIDEARTPHIISGPSMEDVSVYKEVDVVVRQLEKEEHYTADKKNHSASMTEEGMDKVEELMDIPNLAADPKLMHHVNAAVQAYALFDKDVDYVVRGGEVVIVDENTGRMMFGRRYGNGLHQALEAKEQVPVQRESQTIATITFQNLFRLYEKLAGMTGTAKTEEDEFRKIYGLDVVSVPTHRPMCREDKPDIVYKSMEAKMRGVAWEIIRLYSKQQPVLVGTRSIEMSEVVSERMSSDNLQKLMIVKRLQERVEVKKDIKGELKDDAKRIYESELSELKRSDLSMYLPKVEMSGDVLKGDWIEWALKSWELPPENKEYLEEALSHGIPHNILNAKYHEREALIIAEAGRKGQVTIATNMAGRGVDILLGGRIDDELVQRSRAGAGDSAFESAIDDTFKSYRRGGIERAAPPLPLDDQERRDRAEEVRALGGLFILGTERHESRRIDNQLRGRAGRQGDPGESKFYVSLEDTLWKIFNANMMENPVLKMWPPMEEVTAGFLSRMIQKTQERIENHFFEGRKHTLEYDDVLNAQREHIYGMRREILLGKDIRSELRGYIKEVVGEIIENAWMIDEHEGRVYDYSVLFEDLNEMFPLVDYASIEDLEKHEPGEDLVKYVDGLATQAYDAKIESLSDEIMRMVETQVMLRAVNDRWMEHLQTIEYIREGINLRSYAQVDPLVAYKRETFETFNRTIHNIKTDAVKLIFIAQVNVQQAPREDPTVAPMMMRMEDSPIAEAAQVATGGVATAVDLSKIDWKRVGRNDACPCGSGKKFKSCHYPQLRSEGVI